MDGEFTHASRYVNSTMLLQLYCPWEKEDFVGNWNVEEYDKDSTLKSYTISVANATQDTLLVTNLYSGWATTGIPTYPVKAVVSENPPGIYNFTIPAQVYGQVTIH